ncbi:MAG: chromosome segregation protein SMC, partial [Aquificota bacterium]
ENISSFTQSQERKIKSFESEINRLKIRKDALSKKLENIKIKREENFKKLTEVLVKLQHVREDKTFEAIKDISGVYGKVADLISVKDDELTTAIESAGGGRLNNIVVEDDRVAQECINVLRKNKLGKATFIPLNRIRVPVVSKPPLRKGVIGLAVDFVEYPSKIEKAIKYVFSDTVIVENFDSARSLGIGTFRMVTLDGDIFEKSGTISGGSSISKFSLGRGALENEKEKLEKEDDRLKLEESTIENELKKIDNQLKEKENEIYKIKAEGESVIQREKDIELNISNIQNRINTLEDEILNLKKQQFEIENQIENISTELKNYRSLLSNVEEKKKEILEKMENQGLHTLRKQWEEITNKVYRLREEKNNLLNQIESLEDKLENNLKVRIFQIENEKEKLELNIKEKEKLLQGFKEKVEEESKNLTKLWQGLKDKEKERDELLNKIDSLKEQLKMLRYQEDEINKQITFILEDKGKLEQKLEDLDVEIEELLSEYDGQPIEGDLNSLENELSELEKLRREIGAVNQKALEDYEEIKERYLDLKEKVDTLLTEKKSIEELIESLEEKKIQAFMEVYESVNKNLNKMFKRLSPGGKAYLEIENEEDPLSGGILLKARPRGKDVKRLEIMSGGEKTLTALAFLFAVQAYRPAPFYYFDEVDAHLDDANARKIAELMKELSKEAQFIVVTLRDTMASYADRLLGVSAREGISNVYTLDMSDIMDKETVGS